MSTPEPSGPSRLISSIYNDVGLQDEDVPTKRPNKRGQQTRERLLVAATECFAEYGYTRTRISDVVHRAGTAQGNFYRHFSSLDDCFLAVIRPGLEELATAPSSRSGRGGELASLIESNTIYLQTYARHRHILRLLREAAAASPNDGFQDLWLRLRGDFVARTRRWLERLRDAGEIADADLAMVAETIGCLTEQLAYVHVGLPATTPRPERIDQLGRALGQACYNLLPRQSAS